MTAYEKIKNLCEKQGFSISALSDHIPDLKITRASISGWKKGSKPRPENLLLIAKYFNLPVSYFNDNYAPETKEEIALFSVHPENKKAGVKIPVLGEVAAGTPISAIENVDYDDPDEKAFLDLYRSVPEENRKELFALIETALKMSGLKKKEE